MRASIPLPLACKASALPSELIPHLACNFFIGRFENGSVLCHNLQYGSTAYLTSIWIWQGMRVSIPLHMTCNGSAAVFELTRPFPSSYLGKLSRPHFGAAFPKHVHSLLWNGAPFFNEQAVGECGHRSRFACEASALPLELIPPWLAPRWGACERQHEDPKVPNSIRHFNKCI